MFPETQHVRARIENEKKSFTSVEDTESSLRQGNSGERSVVVDDRVSSGGPSRELRDVSVSVVGVEILQVEQSVSRWSEGDSETNLSSSTEEYIGSVPFGPRVISSNSVQVHLAARRVRPTSR